MNLRPLFVFVFLAACSSFNAEDGPGAAPLNADGGTGKEQAPVPGTPALGFSVEQVSERAFVIQGKSLEIPVRITRKAGTADSVAIGVGGLRAGLTVAPLTISPGSTEGKLRVTAAAATPQGPIDLSLSATASDGTTAKGALPIFVRGAPGTVDTTFAPGGLFISGVQDATLTLLADGSMVVAAPVWTGARLVHVDTDGKSLASTDAGVGGLVAPLPDGRYLNFGNDKLARFSAKLKRDTSFNGGTGLVTAGVGTVSDVAVVGGKAYLLSQPDAQNVTVKRFGADGVVELSSCVVNAASLSYPALLWGIPRRGRHRTTSSRFIQRRRRGSRRVPLWV